MEQSYFQYWGKAKKDSQNDGPEYHLLAYHCLDVAACGYMLLSPEEDLCRNLANKLNVDPDWLQSFFTFCLCLHDLGKFARAFQNLVPNLSEKLVGYCPKYIYEVRHDNLGYGIWQRCIAKKAKDVISPEFIPRLGDWLEIAFGHHGQPNDKGKARKALKSHFCEEDELAAESFVRTVIKYWMPDLEPLNSIDPKKFKMISWQLAGVGVLADWLGSNQAHFCYQAEPIALSEYWRKTALAKAKESLMGSAFQPIKVDVFRNIQQQFEFIHEPTPLQVYAQNILLQQGPQLFILEDVTGAGKTEAAMVLVHRLMSEIGIRGVYVGLPTMATANAMYERLGKSYRNLYEHSSLPSLVLAHGATQLSDSFQESVKLSQQPADKQYGIKDVSASAYCNEWLADSRKKALLADVGVGTIDQALLGILPARHQSLRLLGLSDKVLLVDEVHAFDPYMQSLLSVLLQAHAAQGGSAILLSATLPLRHRQQLVSAFAQGVGLVIPSIPEKNTYPLVTHLGADMLRETPIETRNEVKRTVGVKRIESPLLALEIIRDTLEKGHCICWIRNTVKDARESFELLRQQEWVDNEKLSLFHSRFAMIDRQAIELKVLAKFGKFSGQQQRQGQILIATQVVEQSLDLDFDMMISDLAPIDLLIQRAGRLQRHIRNKVGEVIQAFRDERPEPCLFIVSPNPSIVRDKNWLKGALAGTQAVYSHVGRLWLTMKVLEENCGFSMPEDARKIVEYVYGDSVEVPEVLMQASAEAEAEQKAQRGIGEFNCLQLNKGYSWQSAAHNSGWDEDINIPTRIGNDSVDVILAIPEGDSLKPYANSLKHGWALSQLSVPKREWDQAEELISKCNSSAIEKVKSQFSELAWVKIYPICIDADEFYSSETGWGR